MIRLGVDQSYECTGLCVVDDSKVIKILSESFLSHKTHVAKRRRLKEVVEDLIREFGIEEILVERVRLFSQNQVRAQTLMQLSTLTKYVVDAATPANGIVVPVWSVDTRSWKAQVVGKAGATKQETVEHVRFLLLNQNYLGLKEFGFISDTEYDINEDEADATCLALYGAMKTRKVKEEK